jgi:tetratricopeptide (TPR) repeat protein
VTPTFLGLPLPGPEPPPQGGWGRALLLAAALFAVVTVLYFPAVDFRFLAFDDRYYTDRNHVAAGLDGENVVRIFTRIPEEDLFIPVTQLSYMFDVEIFGGTARGFHLTNVLLHGAAMALLLLVLWRATGSLGRSAFAAALVALHPMRVESVAWITERKDVLCALFLFLAVGFHVRFARTGRIRWYAPLFLSALLSLLSKPVAVILPALLLLLDYWPLGRFRGAEGEEGGKALALRVARLAAEKLPLVALSALVSTVTMRLQSALAVRPETLPSRVEHALAAPFIYLWQTVYPVDLVFRYYRTLWGRFSGTLLPAALLFVLAAWAVVRLSRRRPWLAMGWAWYLAAIFPSSGIVPAGSFWISDRFTYLPHAGLAVAAVWSAGAAATPALRKGAAAAGGALLVVLALLSRHQLSFWKDGPTLFGRGLEANRGDFTYEGQYVEELLEAGELDRAAAELDRQEARALDPWYGSLVQNQRLSLLEKRGDRAGAVEAARRYLARDGGFWRTRMRMADDLLALGRYGEAEREYRLLLPVPQMTALERRLALEGLGASLSGLGRDEEALAAFEEALRGGGDDPSSLRTRIARVLARRGRGDEALPLFLDSIRRTPWDPLPRIGAAELLLAAGDVAGAAFQFQEAARLGEGKAEGFYASGRLREGAGLSAEAALLYRKALAAEPRSAETWTAARERLARQGRGGGGEALPGREGG